MNLKYKSALLAALLTTAYTHSALGQETSVAQEIEEMRQTMAELAARLDQLESSNAALKQENADLRAANVQQAEDIERVATQAQENNESLEESVKAASWTDSLRWKGDFRYRYENIDIEDRDPRNRSRIRARAALIADVGKDIEVGIGLASGSEDPVSSNQTLGKGGTSKDLKLDLAYFDYSGIENTNILGGKFKNPIRPVGKNSLLWDSDWRPEGLGFIWDNGTFFAEALGTWLESDSRAGDSFAWIAEAGFRLPLGEEGHFRAGIGAHQFDTRGRRAFFDDGEFFGNSSVTLGADGTQGTFYRYDYEGIQAFAELGWTLFDLPAVAYADYVQNRAVDEFDTGFIVGLKLGSAKAPGSWDLGIAYEDLEADAALGLLVDSDFGGGGTDAKGWIFRGTYALRNNVNTRFTYFINDIDGNLDTEKDFERLMLDVNFKF